MVSLKNLMGIAEVQFDAEHSSTHCRRVRNKETIGFFDFMAI